MNFIIPKIETRNLTILLIILVPLFVVTVGAYAVEVNNSANTTDNSNSANTIVDKKPFQSPSVLMAFGLSVLIIGIITLVTSSIVTRVRLSKFTEEQRKDIKLYRGSFWDIIREGDYNPSLSRFQFLVWTLAISFVVISVFFIRSFGGVPSFPNGDLIPENLLELMGISTAIPVVSNVISRIRYDTSLSNTLPLKTKVPKFATMLFEGNKPTLGRYQMFLWTWISVIFFLFVFFSTVSDTMKEIETTNKDPIAKSNPLRNLSVHGIDSKLVLLMGLSQGGYLAAKLAARQPLKITRFVLDGDKLVSIFGDRFGDKTGIVKMDNKIITTKQDGWNDTRIDLDPHKPFTANQTITIITTEGLSVSEKYSDELW